jgi:hypothetical protein
MFHTSAASGLTPIFCDIKSSNRNMMRTIKVTVCELRNDADGLEQDWKALVEHVKSEKSDRVLLPEMAFHQWVA